MSNNKPSMIMDSLYIPRTMKMEIKRHLVSRFDVPVSQASVIRALIQMWLEDIVPLTIEDVKDFGGTGNGHEK